MEGTVSAAFSCRIDADPIPAVSALISFAADSGAPALVSTTDWGYLRLRREDYTDEALEGWLRAIQSQPWNEAFVFFKHEDEGAAPRLAARLLALYG